MSGYLLDTNVALIALTESAAKLPPAVRDAMVAGPNILSVVSYWEVLLKNMKGHLQIGDPRTWWLDALDQLVATPLALYPRHIAEVYALPALHKDPFDRALVAQARLEELRLVTTDRQLRRYACARLRVIS